MKKVKQLLSTFLFLCILSGMLPISTYSVGTTVASSNTAASNSNFVYINPEYEHLHLKLPEVDFSSEYLAGSEETVSSAEEAVIYLREQLVARNENITVTISGDSYNADWNTILERAFEHTGIPDEGDYISKQYIRMSGSVLTHSNSVTLVYNPIFFTTAAQETAVDTKVASLLSSWDAEYDLETLSDYQKVCLIYDYICDNIVYDYANLEDDTYLLKHSAYAALINGTSVCQGYAVLFYRLALELGVDARYISGTATGPHGWNIVDMGDYYYYLDSTWDAGVAFYKYFLRGSKNFTLDHTPNSEYVTGDYAAQHPIDTEDYAPHYNAVLDSGKCGENVSWSLNNSGVLTISGTGAMYDYPNYVDQPWDSHRNIVKKIIVDEGITTISERAFYYLYKVETIDLPSSLISCKKYAFSNCKALQSISIPEGVTEIPFAAFFACDALTSISLPTAVKTIGAHAFEKTALTDIYYSGTEEQWSEITFADTLPNATIHYNWSTDDPDIPEAPEVPEIPGVIDFGKVTIPAGSSAFAATYDRNGKMLSISAATLSNDRVQVSVNDNVYQNMATAKLFILSNDTYIPTADVKIQTKSAS